MRGETIHHAKKGKRRNTLSSGRSDFEKGRGEHSTLESFRGQAV